MRLGWSGIIISIVISLYSRYLEYREKTLLGISPDLWLTIGLVVFFLAIFVQLAWHEKSHN